MDQITTSLSKCDLKFSQKEGSFSGYGSVFGNVDSHNDVVMPGAYDDVLKSGNPVQVYVNHGWMKGDLPVGQWLNLSSDDLGLRGSADLVMQMPSAVNAYWAMKSELISGLSVAIQIHPDGVAHNKDGTREIHRIKMLKEISIVDSPSNDLSRITSVKSSEIFAQIEGIDSVRAIECFLRDAGGLTKGATLAFLARAKEVFGVAGDPVPDAIEAKASAMILDRLQKLTK